MMATVASHKLGDLSRDEPHLALIYEEVDGGYLGEWVAGVGFINVFFPAESTRELTPFERAQYGVMVRECGGVVTPIVVDPVGGVDPD